VLPCPKTGLRQLRVKPNTCNVPDVFAGEVDGCLAGWSTDTNAVSNYHAHSYAGWNSSAEPGWTYQREEATTYWGSYDETRYTSRGYTQLMPATNLSASLKTIDHLERSRWIDNATRFVALEFTVYAPAIDTIVAGVFAMEFTPAGGVHATAVTRAHQVYMYSTTNSWIFVALGILLFLLCLYKMGRLAGLLRKVGVRNFGSAQVYDSFLCSSILVGLSLHVARIATIESILASYAKHGSSAEYFDDWVAFGELDDAYVMFSGLLVLLATGKFVVLFKHNTKVKRMLHTLYYAALHAMGLVFQIVVVFLAYAFSGYLLFGSQVEEFSTLYNAMATLFQVQLGVIQFEAREAVA